MTMAVMMNASTAVGAGETSTFPLRYLVIREFYSKCKKDQDPLPKLHAQRSAVEN